MLITDDCSEMNKVLRSDAPVHPLWDSEQIGTRMENHVRIAVVNITWEMQADGEYFDMTRYNCCGGACKPVRHD